MSAASSVLLRVIALATAVAACDSEPLPLCGQIPGDGCPVGRGGTCEDASCAALYDCVNGDWVLAEECPGHGGGGGAGEGGSGGEPGEGGCNAPQFDHSNEVDGCRPDLQPPDCPAEAAEVCGDPCLVGCEDFYLCEREGWAFVGFCDADGQLVIEQGT